MSWNVQQTPHATKRLQTLAWIIYLFKLAGCSFNVQPANLHKIFFQRKARHDVYKDTLFGLFTLLRLMLKPSSRPDDVHYLKEERKSPPNSSLRSLRIRNTNYIHFCQKWTYLLTALGTKDYINYQDVGLNIARTVLF